MKTIKISFEITSHETIIKKLKRFSIAELENLIGEKLVDEIQQKPIMINIKSFQEVEQNEKKL